MSDHLAQRDIQGEVCLFGGTVGEPSDVADIRFLIRHLGLASPRQVLDLVAMYYPAGRIPVKTQFLVDGLFEEGLI